MAMLLLYQSAKKKSLEGKVDRKVNYLLTAGRKNTFSQEKRGRKERGCVYREWVKLKPLSY